jgi:protein dithiol:quinone oxidoreductase
MNPLSSLLFKNHKLRMSIVFLGTVILLACGFILEYFVGLTPCPLCIIQRFFFGLTGITALIYALKYPKTSSNVAQDTQSKQMHTLKIYSACMIVFSVLGGAVAARQIWLTYNPPSLLGSNCAPWLGSLTDLIAATFKATADCAEMGWNMLNLSIPEWSLISFVGLALVSSIPFWKKDV